MPTGSSPLRRIESLDLALCLRCNRLSRLPFWRQSFRAVSRLGNGVFWYVLMAALPLLYGPVAWPVVARMTAAGLLGLLIYRWLKHKTSRPRPYQVYAAVSAAAPALDRFSFPSGHTLHAVSFSLVAGAAFPELAPLLWGFTALVALSRPVLGLHYPSDVLAGALLGAGTVQVVNLLFDALPA
jgi:undecaprenyl-diphosphatase